MAQINLWQADYEEDAPFPGRLTLGQITACSGKRVCLDTETNGLYWYKNQVIGVGIHCPDAEVSGYYPALTPESRESVITAVRSWSPDTLVIGHNLKFDLHMLGIDPSETGWKLIDTTVLAHLLDSRQSKKLINVEKSYLGTSSKRSTVAAAPKGMMWEWPTAIVAEYCINDCVVTYQLAEKLIPMVAKMGLWNLHQKEMEYLRLLWWVERHGLLADKPFLEQAKELLTIEQNAKALDLFREIGYEFNWRSGAQLSKAIYEDYGWDRPTNPFADEDGVDRSKFAHKGKYNKNLTSATILVDKAKHPLAPLIMHLREIDKIRNSIEDLEEFSDDNGVVHTVFNQNGTRTARLSSNSPNFQNLPGAIRGSFVKGIEGKDAIRRDEFNLRSGLIASPGNIFASIDYRQMEMRMFGIAATEPKMLQALAGGRDIHSDVAEMVWGERDEVHRDWAKTIGFGLIYGMTTGSLQFRLDMNQEDAQAMTDQYWATFPRVQPWLKEVVREVKRHGYLRYWSGRIWREDDPNLMYRGANALIQGGCADLLSIAALRCAKYLQETGAGAIVNLVHDEILFELKQDGALATAAKLGKIMEVPDLLDMPFFTDLKMGHSFGQMTKIEKEL